MYFLTVQTLQKTTQVMFDCLGKLPDKLWLCCLCVCGLVKKQKTNKMLINGHNWLKLQTLLPSFLFRCLWCSRVLTLKLKLAFSGWKCFVFTHWSSTWLTMWSVCGPMLSFPVRWKTGPRNASLSRVRGFRTCRCSSWSCWCSFCLVLFWLYFSYSAMKPHVKLITWYTRWNVSKTPIYLT